MFANLVILFVGLAWPSTIAFAVWIFREPARGLLARVGTLKLGPQGVEISGPPQPLEAPTSKSDPGASPALPVTLEPSRDDSSGVPLTTHYADPYKDLVDQAEKQGDLALQSTMLNYKENREDALKHLYVDYSVALFLERASRFMLGSQIDALSFLVTVGGRATKDQIRSYYTTAAINFPVIYQNYSFDQWLNFLGTHGLISVDDESVNLTPAGKAIVPYMQGWGYLQFRPPG